MSQPETSSTDAVDPQPTVTRSVPIDGGTVSVARWGDGPASIVMLHDGLGSIRQWRAIPAAVAADTGKTVVAYDRPGHGDSTPVPTGPWPTEWLHLEAGRLARLLPKLDVVAAPLIVGHSDGGSIGLLHAATDPPIRGLLTLAAHSWVEPTCFQAITEMRANPALILRGLSRDHANPEAVFEAWSGVWVSDDFQPWDIRPVLSTVRCPAIIAQGWKDEYAEPSHATETAAAVGNNATHRLLDDVGHLLHHQDPDLVVRLIAEFDRSLV